MLEVHQDRLGASLDCDPLQSLRPATIQPLWTAEVNRIQPFILRSLHNAALRLLPTLLCGGCSLCSVLSRRLLLSALLCLLRCDLLLLLPLLNLLPLLLLYSIRPGTFWIRLSQRLRI